MNTTHNGFRFAELARGESLCSPETCDCCGREGLKRTVKLVAPGGSVVWYGTGCAARAMSCKPLAVRRARAEQFDADAAAIRKSRSDALAAEVNRWLAFLNVAAPNVPKSWDGRSDVHAQIEALGGYAAARDLFKASGQA